MFIQEEAGKHKMFTSPPSPQLSVTRSSCRQQEGEKGTPASSPAGGGVGDWYCSGGWAGAGQGSWEGGIYFNRLILQGSPAVAEAGRKDRRDTGQQRCMGGDARNQ